MKVYLITAVIAIFFSSCLKQSIPDAMLASKNSGGQTTTTATLSYEINGNIVKISVNDADNQNLISYRLGCKKSDSYNLDGLSSSGEITFTFYTDSLTTGNYQYTGIYGDMFFLSHNGTSEYVHDPSDNMSFNITSYNNGHISGTFSGLLTPLITAGNPNNIYGTSGSILITNGSFQNVPVFY